MNDNRGIKLVEFMFIILIEIFNVNLGARKKMNKLIPLFLSLIVAMQGTGVFAQSGFEQDSRSLYDMVLDGSDDGYQQPRGFDQPPQRQAPSGFADPGYGQAPNQRQPLRGRVVVAPAGASFEARISTVLGSGLNSVGDVVAATVSTPLIVGNEVVIPAGSRVIGQVTEVTSARRFMAGQGGKINIRFTSIETPNGQRYPLSAAVDETRFSLSGTASKGTRTAQAAKKAAVGAGVGALSGLVGAAISGGKKGKAAAIGSGIGAGIGLGKAVYDRGEEVVIQSGTILPIRLQQALQAVVPARQ